MSDAITDIAAARRDAEAPVPETCIVCGGHRFTTLGAWQGYNLFRCDECRLGFVHPIPGDAEIAAIYDQYASNESYTDKAQRKVARALKRMRRYAHMAPGKRFLDVGCNVGTSVEAARRLGFEAYGIDIDQASVGIAREIFPGGTYHAGPIESLPPEWGNFDFLFSTEVIEHIPDPHAYFAALSPRVNKGALLYLTTPDGDHWRVPKDFTTWDQVFPPQHLYYFSRDAMRRFLDRHSFDVVKYEWHLKPNLKVLARKR